VPGDNVDKKKFVVGLGNPGPVYTKTRHNVGFRVLETLRRRWELDQGRNAFSGRVYRARLERPGSQAQDVLLLEPYTFMNCSGRAVREIALFYRASNEDILVVLDDLALPLGTLRMRASGSSGTHKGLGDVLAALGTEMVPRLRIGIGSPPVGTDATDFVLSEFRKEEVETIEHAVEVAGDAVVDWVFNGTRYVMDKYNRKPES
jgi:PTH1 family peptidyl-tRNA hydrolase